MRPCITVKPEQAIEVEVGAENAQQHVLLRVHLHAEGLVQSAECLQLMPCDARGEVVHAHVPKEVP